MAAKKKKAVQQKRPKPTIRRFEDRPGYAERIRKVDSDAADNTSGSQIVNERNAPPTQPE
ncbi:MAG: hypothetical protein GY820_39770 [Gammaproteobacteria bacterium]|nr:hypothetical protein [Gammaproteobacteria bacterium]